MWNKKIVEWIKKAFVYRKNIKSIKQQPDKSLMCFIDVHWASATANLKKKQTNSWLVKVWNAKKKKRVFQKSSIQWGQVVINLFLETYLMKTIIIAYNLWSSDTQTIYRKWKGMERLGLLTYSTWHGLQPILLQQLNHWHPSFSNETAWLTESKMKRMKWIKFIGLKCCIAWVCIWFCSIWSE